MAIRPSAALVLAMTTLLAVNAAASDRKPIYKDASAPLDQRVEDLLGRMTLDEKIVQLTTVWTRKSEIFTAGNDFDPRKLTKSSLPASGTWRGPVTCAAPATRSRHPIAMRNKL